MKLKTIFFTLLLLAAAGVRGAEPADTMMRAPKASELIITEKEGGIEVSLREATADSTLQIYYREIPQDAALSSSQRGGSGQLQRALQKMGLKTRSHGSFFVTGPINIGLINTMGRPAGFDLEWGKSFEISWLTAAGYGYRWSNSQIEIGLGFTWHNYKMTGSQRMFLTDEEGIAWGSYPEGSHGKNSRIKTFSLNIPVIYKYYIPHTSLALNGGAIVNFNTYASLRTRWTGADGNEMEDFTKRLHPRRVTVDFYGEIDFCRWLGVFVRYSPMKVLEGHGSPMFSPLSVGISLF